MIERIRNFRERRSRRPMSSRTTHTPPRRKAECARVSRSDLRRSIRTSGRCLGERCLARRTPRGPRRYLAAEYLSADEVRAKGA